MGGGKGGASSPDYTALAQADQVAATQQYQLGQQQLQWGQQQFNTMWPYAQQYLTQQTASSAAETANAQSAQQEYQSTYQPIENQFANQATTYNSPARADQNAGTAEADVANSFNQNRQASLSNLESYGIDPSQTRFGALDLGTRISQAAATAASGTQSRLNTEATGLALEGEAINTGRGYASNVANAYSTATGAGQAGIASGNSTISTANQSTATGAQFYGLGNQSMANQGQVLNSQGQFNLGNQSLQNQASANMSSGIGSLVGGALGAVMNL
jgi:hypothetical protein